ncbi:hypothetical protein MMC14_000003 [Varicellaria rhodocarpa]|nr:hypothetical protein [Varicellaria rhodocarpa]
MIAAQKEKGQNVSKSKAMWVVNDVKTWAWTEYYRKALNVVEVSAVKDLHEWYVGLTKDGPHVSVEQDHGQKRVKS